MESYIDINFIFLITDLDLFATYTHFIFGTQHHRFVYFYTIFTLTLIERKIRLKLLVINLHDP